MSAPTCHLVTGAAGMIGFELTRQLLRQNHKVVAVDNYLKGGKADLAQLQEKHPDQLEIIEGDLTQPGLLDRVKPPVDKVFHMAAIVGVQYVTDHPYQTVRDNCLSTFAVIDWAMRVKPRALVYASSSENYAAGVDRGIVAIPTPEDVPLMIADILLPRWSYAAGKIAGESAVGNAARQAAFKSVIIRFHNVYGPRMKPTHVIPEMIDRAQKRTNPFPVYGCDQTRSFLYVEDAARAVFLAAGGEGGIYNIGSSKEVVILDLAKLIFELTDFHPAVEALPAPPGSVRRRLPDVAKIKKLGFCETVSLEQGIRRCLNEYEVSQHFEH